MAGSRNESDSDFQTIGQTGDWESPQVPIVLQRNRGIFSLRRLDEWRCWRPKTSETGHQQYVQK